jgi:Protein of unknown function (DUF4238)
MARHHYVPQFLLREWATNGRVVAYYFEAASGKVIENAKAAVASACQIPDMNTYFGVHVSQRDFPETGFFTPRVDTPAATALQIMLKKGVRAALINAFKPIHALRQTAQDCARDAANYVHPKLANIQHGSDPDNPLNAVTDADRAQVILAVLAENPKLLDQVLTQIN